MWYKDGQDIQFIVQVILYIKGSSMNKKYWILRIFFIFKVSGLLIK